MSTLRLIADDLTGALDAGAQFTGARGTLPCTLGPVTMWGVEADLAINLGCRDATPAEAAAASRAALPVLDGADLRFKKIDSLLRGHWAAELAAWIDVGGFGTIVLAPAFPAQNRATRGGRQWARFPGRPWSMAEADPAAALAAEGVKSRAVARPFDVPDVAPRTVLICDAETDEDLDQICANLRNARQPVLWCGSAGLARALAGAPPRRIRPEDGRHLAIVGTDHPVSLIQIAHLRDRHPGRVVTFDADGLSSAARIAEALAASGSCLAVADPGEAVDREAAAGLIAACLGDVFGRLPPPDMLTVSGGETFLALCRGLSTDHLLLLGEYAPGLPVSRLIGGAWHETVALSKSGAFGSEDLFTALLG